MDGVGVKLGAFLNLSIQRNESQHHAPAAVTHKI